MLPLLSLSFFPKWNKTLIDEAVWRCKILITPPFQDSSGSHTNLDVVVTEASGCTWTLCNVTSESLRNTTQG